MQVIFLKYFFVVYQLISLHGIEFNLNKTFNMNNESQMHA